MTVQKIYVGSFGPALFDDTEDIGDPDGDFSGETQVAFRTDGSGLFDGDFGVGGDLDVTGDATVGSLKLNDTNASHTLQLLWNEDDTADRILNLLVGGGDRSLTLNEDFTIGDGYNVTITALGQANTLTLNEGFTIGDGSAGTLTFSSACSLTVELASVINQDLTTDASPTFANLSLGTGELTAGSINRAADSLTLEIGGTAVVSVASDSVALGDGGVTNYSKFEADGILEFHGDATVWDDVNVGAMLLTLPAANQPDVDTFVDEAGDDTGIETYAFAVGEEIHGSFELEHRYKEGSNITFHIHWQGKAAPTGTDYVNWQLTYTLARDDTTLDAVTTITKEIAFDTQYEFMRTDFDEITGTNFKIEDQFLFTLERVASAGDAYAGDALVATVGIHFEIDTVGSRQITTK